MGAVLLRVVEVLRTAPRPCPRRAPASNRGYGPWGRLLCACYFAYSVFSVPASWLPHPARVARTGGCGGTSPTRYKTAGKVAEGHRTASCLPLALLVPGVRADHHDAAVATDDPALAADLLDARLDLHGELLLSGGCGGSSPHTIQNGWKVTEGHQTAFCMPALTGRLAPGTECQDALTCTGKRCDRGSGRRD
jgi:hypothetical protein